MVRLTVLTVVVLAAGPRAFAGEPALPADPPLVPIEINSKPVFELTAGEDGAWYAITREGLHKRKAWTDDWILVSRQSDLLNLLVMTDGLCSRASRGFVRAAVRMGRVR